MNKEAILAKERQTGTKLLALRRAYNSTLLRQEKHILTVKLTKATDSKHKYTVKVSGSTGQHTVHFGQAGASDFTKHEDPRRMAFFVFRHGGKRNGTDTWYKNVLKKKDEDIIKEVIKIDTSSKEHWSDITTAGFWSRWLLWSYPSLPQAKSFMEKKFKFRFI